MPDSSAPSTSSLMPPISSNSTSLDIFCLLLQQNLKYNPGERDLIVLHHEFGIKLKDGKEVHNIYISEPQMSEMIGDDRQ